MKSPLSRMAIIAMVSCLVLSCSKSSDEKPLKRYTIRQFMDIVQINGGSFSPDETKVLISGKETGIFNAEEIDIKTGEKKPITNSADNAVFALSYFPAD